MVRMTALLLLLSAALLAGCGNKEGAKEDPTTPSHEAGETQGSGTTQEPGESHDAPDSGEEGHHGPASATPAPLPAGANDTCPVMGGPVDPNVFAEYKGKKVYFCCDECLGKFEKDPESYFEKAYPDAGDR